VIFKFKFVSGEAKISQIFFLNLKKNNFFRFIMEFNWNMHKLIMTA